MANNPYVSKVIYGNSVIIDLTSDDVTASDVINGKYVHLKSGERVQGTCTYDADTSDAGASASDILSGETAYVNGSKVTGSMANNGAVALTIDDIDDEIAIPVGYHDGSGTVTIDSTEKAKILESNIKSGVSILGVTGTYSGEAVSAGEVNITPYTTAQTVLPPTGKDYISQANVAAIAYSEVDDQASGGKIVTIGTVAPTT